MANIRFLKLRVPAALGLLLLMLGGCLAAGGLPDSDLPATGSQPGAAQAGSTATAAPAVAPAGVSESKAPPATAAPAVAPAGASESKAPSAPAASAERLLVIEGGGPEMRFRLLDSEDGTSEERPLGFLSPDGATLYTLEKVRGGTIVRAIEMASGREVRQTKLAGAYFVPAEPSIDQQLAISRDGRRMILKGGVTDAEAREWEKAGKPRSRYAVLDTDFAQPAKLVDLEGEFWFDALSKDGALLYLIEIQDAYPMSYSPEVAPNYQVRVVDVESGSLLPNPVVDKRELEQMSGYRRAGVFSRRGDWLYSVYTRADKEPFIHALNLPNQAALCIDLPFEPAESWEHDMTWAAALGPGGMLYAVNAYTGQVAQVDTTNGHTVVQSATVESPWMAAPTLLERLSAWLAPVARAKIDLAPSAAVTPDGKRLLAVGEKGVLSINTADLSLAGRYLTDLRLSGLVLSADGARGYVVDRPVRGSPRLLSFDTQTGELLGEVDGVSAPWSVVQTGGQ